MKRKRTYVIIGLFLFFTTLIISQNLVNSADVATFTEGYEGDFYQDENNVYYVGLSDGSLKEFGIVTQQGSADDDVLKWNDTSKKWEANTPDIAALIVAKSTIVSVTRSRIRITPESDINTGNFTITPDVFELNETSATIGGTSVSGLSGNLRFVFQPYLSSAAARTNFNCAFSVNGTVVSKQAGSLYARNSNNHDQTGTVFIFEYEAATITDQFEFILERESNTGTVALLSSGTNYSYLFIENYQHIEVVTSVTAEENLAIAQGPAGPMGPAGPAVSAPTDVYHAAGNVASDGTPNYIQGATVTQTGTGSYSVSFTVPHISGANYPVIFSMEQNPGQDDYVPAYLNVTASGFDVEVTEQDNGGSAGVPQDAGFSFYVPL